jgi:hypothetical protein
MSNGSRVTTKMNIELVLFSFQSVEKVGCIQHQQRSLMINHSEEETSPTL